MDQVPPQLGNFDFTDAWLLSFEVAQGQLLLRIDARDLSASANEGRRVYKVLNVYLLGIRSTQVHLGMPAVECSDEDLCAVSELTIEKADGACRIKLVLEYGSIKTIARELVLDVGKG